MRLRSDAGAVAVRRGPLPGGGAVSYAIAIGWSARIYPRQHPPKSNNEGGKVKRGVTFGEDPVKLLLRPRRLRRGLEGDDGNA